MSFNPDYWLTGQAQQNNPYWQAQGIDNPYEAKVNNINDAIVSGENAKLTTINPIVNEDEDVTDIVEKIDKGRGLTSTLTGTDKQGPDSATVNNVNTLKNQILNNANQNTTGGPFQNLLQKAMNKFSGGKWQQAKWDENEFMMKDGEKMLDDDGNPIINKNFGQMIDKGKGLFGKEGGFMSKFGTGKGGIAGGFLGALGGLGKGLGGLGGGGEGDMQAPSEYMYKNPWQGVQ